MASRARLSQDRSRLRRDELLSKKMLHQVGIPQDETIEKLRHLNSGSALPRL